MKQYVASTVTPTFGHKATRRSFSSPTNKVLVYDCVQATGPSGLTAREIAAAVNLPIERVRFHLSELGRAGYVMVKGQPATAMPHMTAQDAAFAAMLSLENALIARVREDYSPPKTVPIEMDRAFVKYNKVKELALRPGTGPEGRIAIKMAILELVRVVY